MLRIVLVGGALHACVHGTVETYNTPCGRFTGTLEGYRAFLETCGVQGFMAQRERYHEQMGVAIRGFQASIAAREGDPNAPEGIARDLLQIIRAEDTAREIRIAVMPIRCGVDESVCTRARNRIEAALVVNGDVTLLERQRIDDVVRERKLQRTSAFDSPTAVSVGQFMGASHVLLIEVTAGPPDGRAVSVNARIVDVRGTRISAASNRAFRP